MKYLIYMLITILFLLAFSSGNILLVIILLIAGVIYIGRKILSNNENIISESSKLCKHCRSEMDIDATVCPTCRRNQSNANNPIWLVPIFVIIGFFFYCLLSPNAPDTAREIFCSIGLRDGFPYCYKVNTDTLNEIINRYNY